MTHTHTHAFFKALACPRPVTWTKNIKGMFTNTDIDHMRTKGIDLSSYQSVMINAVFIYNAVSSGYMPPPGSGETQRYDNMVTTFRCWI